jgi:hypothetical protein
LASEEKERRRKRGEEEARKRGRKGRVGSGSRNGISQGRRKDAQGPPRRNKAEAAEMPTDGHGEEADDGAEEPDDALEAARASRRAHGGGVAERGRG